MSHAFEYDYLIINDQLEQAYHELERIVLAQRNRCSSQTHRHSALLEQLLAKAAK